MLHRFVLITVLMAGCTDEVDSQRTLESSGYTDIQFNGYAWFGCGEGDSFATEFTAKNPAGNTVSGVVCCGMLKSCTVRF